MFISDLKLQVRADRAFYYPDVFVTCAGGDRAQSHFKSEPILVAEVLSPATSAYDRGAKFASHRKLPSLREYVVLDSERVSVDLFRRDESGRWILYPSEAGEQVELASVDLALPLEALYADVRLEQSERKQQTRQ